MGARQFAVERLGIGAWPSIEENADRVITSEMWVALADPASKIHRARTFALSVEPGQAWATLSAAGEREDGLYHIGVVDHNRGIGWVVERCVHWLERFPGSVFVVDPRSDLADLLTDLSEAGIQPITTSAAEVKDACGAMFRSIVEKRLRYPAPQPELDIAVAGARTEKLLDGWKWSWKSSAAVITPLVSATLALWGARTQGVPEVHSVREALERLKAEQDPQPVAPAPEPVAAGVNFIPLDQMPVRRGLFLP
jgi:hypothetical protein